MRLPTLLSLTILLSTLALAQRRPPRPNTPPTSPSDDEETNTPTDLDDDRCSATENKDDCCARQDPAARFCSGKFFIICYLPGRQECCSDGIACAGAGCCEERGEQKITPDPDNANPLSDDDEAQETMTTRSTAIPTGGPFSDRTTTAAIPTGTSAGGNGVVDGDDSDDATVVRISSVAVLAAGFAGLALI